MLISYAQQAEDVLLHRALGPGVSEGFYVDVGAGHPTKDSVTRFFYERGWRGVNVEPQPHLHELLQRARPRDRNLQVAIDASPGTQTLYQVGRSKTRGHSTLSAEVAEEHRQAGSVVETLSVEVRTLDSVLDEASVDQIQFLKIDVEGRERGVLESVDLRRHRPWIVVVESLSPLSMQPTHAEWEALLTDRGYSFTLSDGLNRYYAAEEQPEVAERLERVLDGGQPYRRWRDLGGATKFWAWVRGRP